MPQNLWKVLVKELLTDDSSYVMELNIGNKKHKVHKTILASKSVYFESLLQSGHFNPENDVYGQEMKYLIQYCYGSMEKVPPVHQIPLVKLAKMHEMNDLECIAFQQIELTVDSFIPLVSCLSDERDCNDEKFGPFIERLVQFAVKNSRVINKDTIQHIPIHIKDRIMLAMAHQLK